MRSCRSKYHARKTTAYGIEFDSKKEAMRYSALVLLERAGVIQDLQRQVKYVLIPAQVETIERYSEKTGKRLKDKTVTVEQECAYIADFVYWQDGKQIVEDVKGMKKGTAYAVFTIKRKLMLYIHGIKVKEI